MITLLESAHGTMTGLDTQCLETILVVGWRQRTCIKLEKHLHRQQPSTILPMYLCPALIYKSTQPPPQINPLQQVRAPS
jgi:hypothetical protein